jgi:hypothetical protein
MTSEAETDSPASSSVRDSPLEPLPRLRIHHIMLWTALTAAWLTLAKFVFEALTMRQPIQQFNLLAAAIVYGAATAVAGLGIYWRVKGMAFFTQPGHWLACWIMLSILWSIAASLLLYWQFQATAAGGNVWQRADESWLLWLLLNPWIRIVVVGAGMFFLAVWAADTIAWRVFFAGWAVLKCLPAVMGRLGWGQWLGSSALLQWWMLILHVAPLALLGFAALSDFRNRRARHRHWSHWAGILVSASLMFFELVMYAWLWIAPPQTQ